MNKCTLWLIGCALGLGAISRIWFGWFFVSSHSSTILFLNFTPSKTTSEYVKNPWMLWGIIPTNTNLPITPKYINATFRNHTFSHWQATNDIWFTFRWPEYFEMYHLTVPLFFYVFWASDKPHLGLYWRCAVAFWILLGALAIEFHEILLVLFFSHHKIMSNWDHIDTVFDLFWAVLGIVLGEIFLRLRPPKDLFISSYSQWALQDLNFSNNKSDINDTEFAVRDLAGMGLISSSSKNNSPRAAAFSPPQTLKTPPHNSKIPKLPTAPNTKEKEAPITSVSFVRQPSTLDVNKNWFLKDVIVCLPIILIGITPGFIIGNLYRNDPNPCQITLNFWPFFNEDFKYYLRMEWILACSIGYLQTQLGQICYQLGIVLFVCLLAA
jgi:hypothetical protein